jgi:hypothetical protein
VCSAGDRRVARSERESHFHSRPATGSSEAKNLTRILGREPDPEPSGSSVIR